MCFQMMRRENFTISLGTQLLMEIWGKIRVDMQISKIRFPGEIPDLVEGQAFILKEIRMIFLEVCLVIFSTKEISIHL